MKKKVWFVGMAVAAMTSCTQSEVLDVPESRLIGFETHVEKQTRAINDITDGSADFREFHVFGAVGTGNSVGNSFTVNDATYIHHALVTGGVGNWTYDPHASWLENHTFRFAAYANGKGDGTSNAAQIPERTNETDINTALCVEFIPNELDTESKQTWGLDLYNYTVGGNDLIVAVPGEKVVNSITTAPPSVGLTFKHVLAKVIFQFRYTTNIQNPNLHLEIEPFNVNAYHTGDCELRFTGVENNTKIGAEWTPEGTLSSYEFFPQIAGDYQTWSSGNIQSEYYVIPQSNEGLIADQIVIRSIQNNLTTETTTFTNVPLKIVGHTDWLPGYVYRYVADITPGQHYIHFTTSVTSWIDEDNRNQTITPDAPTPTP